MSEYFYHHLQNSLKTTAEFCISGCHSKLARERCQSRFWFSPGTPRTLPATYLIDLSSSRPLWRVMRKACMQQLSKLNRNVAGHSRALFRNEYLPQVTQVIFMPHRKFKHHSCHERRHKNIVPGWKYDTFNGLKHNWPWHCQFWCINLKEAMLHTGKKSLTGPSKQPGYMFCGDYVPGSWQHKPALPPRVVPRSASPVGCIQGTRYQSE